MEKPDFTVVESNDGKKFNFSGSHIRCNSFEIEIKNNSGYNITSAFSPYYKIRNNFMRTANYTKIEVEIENKATEILWIRPGVFKPAVTKNNPWKDGEKRVLFFEESYNNSMSGDLLTKHSIRDYEIKGARLMISLKATNEILDYDFDEHIKELDLKKELIEFSQTLK